MNKSVNADFRMGLTGSLDGTEVNELIVHGLFGRIYRYVTTRELMDRGILAKLNINMKILNYKNLKSFDYDKKNYQSEMKFLTELDERNEFIVNLTSRQSGNTLVLFNTIKHGKLLHELISNNCPDREVYLVYGDVSAEDREKVRREVNRAGNAIIVASYGTFSTGINIPNISNLIFASFSKSQVRVLQSIGRGLRKYKDKICNLYDLSDDLRIGKRKNYSYKHAEARLAIYKNEDFEYNIQKVTI
jgi:superfamily II DNA or RNA helicase